MSTEIEIVVPRRATDALEIALVDLTEAISKIKPDGVASGLLGGEFGYGAEWSNDVFEMHPFDWEPECDCGAHARRGSVDDWWLANPHSENCYQSEMERRLRKAHLSSEEIFALAGNGIEPPFGPAQERKRRTSWEAYDAARAAEGAIRKALCAERGLTYPYGCAVHCDCGADKACGEWLNSHPCAPGCRFNRPNFLHRQSGLRVEWYKWIGRDTKVVAPKGTDAAAIVRECIASLSRKAALQSPENSTEAEK